MNHFYKSIPGWFSFADCYVDAVRRAKGGEIFVEVGAWKGKSSAFMGVEIANAGKPIEFHVVDHWKGSDEAVHHADPDVQAGRLYEVWERNVAPVRKHLNPLRMSSVEAAELFLNATVDFLLLDGDHTYEGVSADLAAWLPKMKPGATIAGDDWNWKGVQQAVCERFLGRWFGNEGQVEKIQTTGLPHVLEILGEGKGRHWRVRL